MTELGSKPGYHQSIPKGTICPYRTGKLDELDSKSKASRSWWYCTSEHIDPAKRYIPSPVKILILIQSLVITYLAFWMVENYQNDFYFQTYVNSSLQGSGFTIVALSSVGIFSAVAMGLYTKLRRTHRELEHLILTEHAPSEEQGASSILHPQVEQHLIEMIRKATPTDTAGSASMPTLKREANQSAR